MAAASTVLRAHARQWCQLDKIAGVGLTPLEQVKAELYADSQARDLPEIVGRCSRGKIYMDGLVKPANLSNVIYKNIESRLVELSKSRPVRITTIPPCFDKEQNDTIHYNLALANRHIKDLVSKLNNVELIDLDTFKRNRFSRQGMHLNYSGKRKLAFMISDFLLKITSENQKTIQEANNDGPKKKNCLENRVITITDMNMADVIRHFRYKKNVDFAHSISGDFYHPRHMSAGVAAVFGRLFGRPETSQCLTDHLAVQDKTNCASVFSLITKSRYFGKPAKHDYDIAFGDLAHNFKKRRLNHLICSPIGCVRDKIELTHFIDNLLKFQQKTKAKITIVSYFQKSHLNPTTAQAEMMTSSTSTPTAAANEISHATTQCEQVKVVPGVFTFSEMLKQSNTTSAESANTSPVCAISENSLLKIVNSSFRSDHFNSDCCVVDSPVNLNSSDQFNLNLNNSVYKSSASSLSSLTKKLPEKPWHIQIKF
ncbi:hypothetical protein J6590_082165 [Homalodisca vitripennis]|nr:hypothetical protein J6590_082165 [Homalodisca vitripennis]